MDKDLERIRVVLVVEGAGARRGQAAGGRPVALWPVGDRTIFENMVGQLAEQGVRSVAVVTARSGVVEERSSGGASGSSLVDEETREESSRVDEKSSSQVVIHRGGQDGELKIEYFREEMARGRGGMIKDSSGVAEEWRSGGASGSSQVVEESSRRVALGSRVGELQSRRVVEEAREESSRVDEKSSSRVGGEIAAAEQNGLAMTVQGSRLVVEESSSQVVVLMQANMVRVPDLRVLAAEHLRSGADLSVVVGESEIGGLGRDGNQIFIAGRAVLELVPEVGYCDIKEMLIPAMVRKGMKVRRVEAPEGWGCFGGWREYVEQVLQRLAVSGKPLANNLIHGQDSGSRRAELEQRKTEIDETARLHGQVWVGCGACIEEDAVIVGPAVIGRNCRIGRGAVVTESVLWEGSCIEEGAAVTECLVDAGAVVGAGAEISGEWCRGVAVRGDCATHGQDARATLRARTAVKCQAASLDQNAVRRGRGIETVVGEHLERFAAKMPPVLKNRVPATAWWWVGAGAVAACFLWSYWNPTIVSLWGLWMRSDEFSSGLLVPFLAVYILWSRRHALAEVEIRPAIVWGLAAFAAAQAMRFLGLWLMYASAERISLVLTICALALLLFGWRMIWRVWPVLAFLFLMLPLPARVQAWITVPLQRWATTSAVFGLEMLGFEVERHGNVIDLNGTMVAVAEACNGLRMLTAFVVIAALVALVVERRWWEKAILVASSVPIAFACNTLRLIITAIAFTRINTEAWEKAFHDFGGLAMMPVALGMVMGLLWLLSNVVVQPEERDALESCSGRRLVVKRQIE